MGHRNGALAIPDAAVADAESAEMIRAWVAQKALHCALRIGVWDDPAAWGILLADVARHVANAHQESEGKDPAEKPHRLVHEAGFGIRAEVGSTIGLAAARDEETRKRLARHLQHGIGLVVTEGDVVPRLMRLDELGFKQEGLGFGGRHAHLDIGHGGHHLRDARRQVGRASCLSGRQVDVGGDPLAQGEGLADVQELPARVSKQVHAGLIGKLRYSLSES